MPLPDSEAARRWSIGKSGASGNMLPNGDTINSYALLIGFTTKDGDKIALDYSAKSGNFYSVTTSRHCSTVSDVAKKTINPKKAGIETGCRGSWGRGEYTLIPERLLDGGFDKPGVIMNENELIVFNTIEQLDTDNGSAPYDDIITSALQRNKNISRRKIDIALLVLVDTGFIYEDATYIYKVS